MTAVSQFWLGGCFEEFLTFQMEPMWPDSVGWFTFCQTWVCEAQKTASLPENVKQLWQVFAGTVLWCYFEESWQRLTLVLRLTVSTQICICKAFVQINNIWCGSWRSSLLKKKTVVPSEMKQKTSGPGRVCISDATMRLVKGNRCCTGHSLSQRELQLVS